MLKLRIYYKDKPRPVLRTWPEVFLCSGPESMAKVPADVIVEKLKSSGRSAVSLINLSLVESVEIFDADKHMLEE